MAAMTRHTVSATRRAPSGSFSSTSVTRTKSPCLKACDMAKKEAAAQNQATTSFTAPVRTPNSRSTLWATISTQISKMKTAPMAPLARKSQSRNRRISSLLVERVDQRLAVRAGLLLPIGQHHRAHLLEVGHQLGRRRDDLHALLGERLLVPLVLFLADLPAAVLGFGRRLRHCLLRGLVQRIERFLVHQ